MKTFDLLIPCHNPVIHWELHLIAVLRTLEESNPEVFEKLKQVIVVDDGSTKNVQADEEKTLISSGLPFRLIHNSSNSGKGYSVRAAAKHSSASFCIYTDIDIPYGIKSIVDVYHALVDNADIVIAERDKAAYYQRATPVRRFVSRTLIFMNSCLLGLPYADSQAGIKGLNPLGKALLLSTTVNEFLFDLELLTLSHYTLTASVVKVPVKNIATLRLTNFKMTAIAREVINFIHILCSTNTRNGKKNIAWG